jgi:flagellum-specific ATP synthase
MFSPDALSKLRSLRSQAGSEGGTNRSAESSHIERQGKVKEVLGSSVEVHLPGAPLGARVLIEGSGGLEIEGEVVGFRRDHVIVAPLSDPMGICANAVVTLVEREPTIRVGPHLIGRVVDGYLRPIDNLGPITAPRERTLGSDLIERMALELPVDWKLVREPLNPMQRQPITRTLDLGVRSMNALLTCGVGQRIGIMAGSGVGKSVLLGMIARYAAVDINVIGLIGERGREVREFIENCLGPEGLARSVVVVSTGDQSPLARIRAAHATTAIGEYFREQGANVLLMMDSLTRVAMAQREIGLAVGEPPTSKGYTPSVFSLLPKLLERAGNSASNGSLTGIYTVLVDGDDFSDPICDAARSILDGHINLSRQLAAKNQFPAIDVLSSASRVMDDIAQQEHLTNASRLRDIMATFARYEDAVSIGAYESGSNPKLDQALLMLPRIEAFLRQDRKEVANLSDSLESLSRLLDGE